MERLIDVFRMYIYRSVLRIWWMERPMNKKVLNMMGKSSQLMRTIKEKKLQYIGHIMRGENYEILRLVIEGKKGSRKKICEAMPELMAERYTKMVGVNIH